MRREFMEGGGGAEHGWAALGAVRRTGVSHVVLRMRVTVSCHLMPGDAMRRSKAKIIRK
jgi:hypothetical protein